ncbi:hypothetical protein [Endozoicomonas sp. SESOKO3]|nr:hypothetical protein [Endozoicomonas sp. SESOKO3]
MPDRKADRLIPECHFPVTTTSPLRVFYLPDLQNTLTCEIVF